MDNNESQNNQTELDTSNFNESVDNQADFDSISITDANGQTIPNSSDTAIANTQTVPDQESSKQTSTSSGVLREEETAILEYLDIVKSEYEIERNKKESFENRAGIVLALVGALCVFVLETIPLGDIVSMFPTPMTFQILLKIVFGITVYVSIAVSIIRAFLTITTRKHDNFEVKDIDEVLLSIDRMTSLAKIIFTYRDIISQHRDLNEKRSKDFKFSLIFCIFSICAIAVYSLIEIK